MNDVVIIDNAAIEEVKATMRAQFPQMVQYFFEDSASYIAAIREGITAASVEKIVAPAHTLKSSARQMGAMRVSEIAKVIEENAREQISAKQNNILLFVDMLAHLEAAFAETREAYKPHAA